MNGELVINRADPADYLYTQVSFAKGTYEELERSFKGKKMPLKCEVFLDVNTGKLYFTYDNGSKLTNKNKNDIIYADNKSRGYISFEALAGSGLEGTI